VRLQVDEHYSRHGRTTGGIAAPIRCGHAAARGVEPGSDEAQELARRHFDWLRGIPGTPGGGTTGPTKEYFLGLGEMYVADPRFAKNYGGEAGATFVRDAMRVFAERNL
jgi:hypothetical protein